MRDKITAREYLEEQQKLAYEQVGYSVEKLVESSKKDRLQRIEEILEKQSDFISEEEKIKLRNDLLKYYEKQDKWVPPSKYEHPGLYHLIMSLANSIESGAGIINFSDVGLDEKITEVVGKRRPIFASMPTGYVNALSRYFPASNEYLVILEDQLFMFCNLLSKIVAKAMPLTKREKNRVDFSFREEDILSNLVRDKQILRRFRELTLFYLIKGKPSDAPPYLLEAPFDRLASSLRDGMEIFVLSHEYGHVVLGHLESSQTTKLFLSNQDVINMTFSWDQELEADSIGLVLTLATMKNKGWNISLGYMGCDLFFGFFEMVERGICIIRNGNDDNYWRGGKIDGPVGTHPPAEVRRQKLREFMTEKFPEESLHPAEATQIVLKHLWGKTWPILKEYHKEKGNLNARWNLRG